MPCPADDQHALCDQPDRVAPRTRETVRKARAAAPQYAPGPSARIYNSLEIAVSLRIRHEDPRRFGPCGIGKAQPQINSEMREIALEIRTDHAMALISGELRPLPPVSRHAIERGKSRRDHHRMKIGVPHKMRDFGRDMASQQAVDFLERDAVMCVKDRKEMLYSRHGLAFRNIATPG